MSVRIQSGIQTYVSPPELDYADVTSPAKLSSARSLLGALLLSIHFALYIVRLSFRARQKECDVNNICIALTNKFGHTKFRFQ